MIERFIGKYAFLSNFYESPIAHGGVTFGSVEAAFQAQKCPSMADKFGKLTPSKAKKLGRRVQLRSDWENIRVTVMYNLLTTKFEDPELRKKLLDTGDAKLIEGNSWGDRYWGTVNGEGRNVLGKLLMKVRDDIREEKA